MPRPGLEGMCRFVEQVDYSDGCQNSPVLRASIEALHASVAVVDADGGIVAVNERWRGFGAARNAESDYVGMNYLAVCAAAYSRGDTSALRVQTGLRRLLEGESDSFGLVYHCSENSFRMRALPLGMPLPGFIVAHEDITDLLKARRERRRIARDLRQVRDGHAAQLQHAHEELA